MNDVTLLLPAVLLPAFCLICSLTIRRTLYLPLPKGTSAKWSSPHAVFIAMLCGYVVTATLGLAGTVGAMAFVDEAPLALANLSRTVLRVISYCLFARYVWLLPKGARRAAAVSVAVTVIGAAIQAFWSVQVEPFFAAVGAFGCMVFYEQEPGAADDGMGDAFRTFALVSVTATFLMAIVINSALQLNLILTQADAIGQVQLDAIGSELHNAIADAEEELLQVAIRAEQLTGAGASREALEDYIADQHDIMLPTRVS